MMKPMDVELLIGDIVRQTTVLIAQLSTAAGARTPLHHIADQVFLDLARELEAQGVGKKVAADMFGLALRTYQVKVQRMKEGVEEEQATLWQSLHDELATGSRTRADLQSHFSRHDPNHVAALLHDMVQSGIAYSSGRGPSTVYGLTTAADRARAGRQESGLESMLWYLVASGAARTRDELIEQVKAEPNEIDRLIAELTKQGRLRTDAECLTATKLEIPLGAAQGWEVAVCDHYRAVTTAIAAKVSEHGRNSPFIGGGTVSFRMSTDHPLRAQVLAQPDEVRTRLDSLWSEVARYNETHGVGSSHARVTFYYGQNIVEDESPDETNEA